MEMLRQADKMTLESFSRAMQSKMLKKQIEGYGGWDDPEQVSLDDLKAMLREHVEKGDMVDVGNLAMMVWWRELLTPGEHSDQAISGLHHV